MYIESEPTAECVEILKSMGLGDYVHIRGERPWRWPTDFIIRDPQGKAIVCRNGWEHHIARAASEILDMKIESIRIDSDTAIYTTQAHITIPERHSIAIMNRYFDEYRPGFHKSEAEITLPHALHALSAPANFLNEPDAYELAMALQNAFPRNDVDVTSTGDGFAVVVRDDVGDLDGWATERIAAIAQVVESFSLTTKEKLANEIIYQNSSSSADWQLATANKHTQQARIEKKLDRLLAILDSNTPVEAAISHDNHTGAARPCNGIMSKLDEILLALKRLEVKTALAIEPAGMAQ